MLPKVIFWETVSPLMPIKRPSHSVESLYIYMFTNCVSIFIVHIYNQATMTATYLALMYHVISW